MEQPGPLYHSTAACINLSRTSRVSKINVRRALRWDRRVFSSLCRNFGTATRIFQTGTECSTYRSSRGDRSSPRHFLASTSDLSVSGPTPSWPGRVWEVPGSQSGHYRPWGGNGAAVGVGSRSAGQDTLPPDLGYANTFSGLLFVSTCSWYPHRHQWPRRVWSISLSGGRGVARCETAIATVRMCVTSRTRGHTFERCSYVPCLPGETKYVAPSVPHLHVPTSVHSNPSREE